MQRNEAALRSARDARARLGAIECDRPPYEADPFDWSADVLDELVRVALDLARISAGLAGDPDGEIEYQAAELATAIVRRRNAALRAPVPARQRVGPGAPVAP